jgi:hypothetical protein
LHLMRVSAVGAACVNLILFKHCPVFSISSAVGAA